MKLMPIDQVKFHPHTNIPILKSFLSWIFISTHTELKCNIQAHWNPMFWFRKLCKVVSHWAFSRIQLSVERWVVREHGGGEFLQCTRIIKSVFPCFASACGFPCLKCQTKTLHSAINTNELLFKFRLASDSTSHCGKRRDHNLGYPIKVKQMVHFAMRKQPYLIHLKQF